jgi:general secretion pathway protein D
MKMIINSIKKGAISLFVMSILTATATADCNYELFSISAAKGTTIEEFIEQLSNSCEFSVIVKSSETQKKLSYKLNNTHIKNLTIHEVLDIILKEHNLHYTLENSVLKISYLQTKTYNIDYILSIRKGSANTDVTLSSSQSGTSSSGTAGSASGESQSGTKIESTDEVVFWDKLDAELLQILNRPEDEYTAQIPIINRNAGLITISATTAQLERLDSYLADLQKKIQYQVLIDVHILSVSFDDSSSTGIDWSQIYKLQNVNLEFGAIKDNTGAIFSKPSPIADVAATTSGIGRIAQFTGGLQIQEIVKFLKNEGDVRAISNPKILTLNNQPALITVGSEYFYKITSSTTTTSSGGSDTATSDEINSVFAGVLLDITPEISDDDTITLKINPSISETVDVIASSATRSMPPDLTRKQLSSVVTVKDGNKVVLGGLINRRNSIGESKVPLLGDIPLLGYAFKRETKATTVEELVIIIEPHIIKKVNTNLNLSDLGYKHLDTQMSLLNDKSSETNSTENKKQ